MTISKTIRTAALAAAIVAIPGLALAQTTGTRLPTHPDVTVVDGVTVVGAIDDGKQQARGEDPADLAMADIPVVYDDPAAADQPQAAKPADQPK
ncbi:MAG: hypothetical protein K1X35_00405 [Caulobacteraceae bacterium]|nr:hypothetical protein [Caulobacteraceae bacterium]